MQENLVAGLVSGLVVTILVLIFSKFWIAVLIPWFENRVYKDVRIEGKWYGCYPASLDLRQDVINLKRHGHSIVGTMVCTHGGDVGDEYSVCGSFRNMLLPLVYESTDKKKTDMGAITLMCLGNGERLAGKIALYSTHEDAVIAGSIIWYRKKDELDAAVKRDQDRRDRRKELEETRKRISKEESDIENDEAIEGEIASEESNANKKMQPTAEALDD